MNMSIVVVKIWALFFLIAVPIFPGDINLDLEPKEQIEKFIFKKIFPNTQSWSKIREKIIATSKDVPYKILQYAAKIDFFEKKNTKGKIVQLRKLKGLNIETLQIAQEGGLFKVNNTQGDLRSQDIGSDAKEKILKSLQGMDLESLRLVIEAGVLRDLSLERRLLVLKHIQTASPAFIKDDVLPEFEKDKANFKTLMNLLRLNQNENPAQSCDVKILNRPSAEEGISDQSFSKKSGRSLSYSSSYNSAQKYLQRRRDLEKNKRTCEQFLFEKIFPNTEKDSKTREKILLVSQEVPYEILEYSTNIGFFQGLNTREKISQLGALKDVNPDTLDIAQEYHLFELENPKDHPYILLNLGFVYPETLKTIFENFKFEKIDGPGRKKILESLQGMDPESLRLMMNAGVLTPLTLDEKLRVLKHIQKSSSSFIEEEVLPQFRETPKDFKALIQILSQDSFHDSIKTLSDEKKNLLEQSKLLDKARHREGNKIIETLKSVDSDVFSLALKKGIWNFSPRESLNILRALQKVSKSQFKKALKLQGNMDSKNQGSKTIIAALKNLLL